MSIKDRRKILIAAELVLAVLICLVAWWALKVEDFNDGAQSKNASAATNKSTKDSVLAENTEPVGWYTQVMHKPLRRPLYDPKPEPPKVVRRVEKPLRLQLLGTVIESDKSSAILKTSRGDTKFARIGDVIEEAELIQIESNKVLFNFDGRQVELTRQQDGAKR